MRHTTAKPTTNKLQKYILITYMPTKHTYFQLDLWSQSCKSNQVDRKSLKFANKKELLQNRICLFPSTPSIVAGIYVIRRC